MSCGCNRPGHGPEPHSPVPLHAPLPSHSAIPLKGGSVFFNVIDHLKRQIDRLFKGKADLVDGKVPDDQLPERQVGTVAWDDVKGKPTEFPPSAHGHEDLRQLIVEVSAAVTQIDGRVEFAETAAASAVGTANSAQDLARTASLTAGDAELEARNAAGDAGTALEKAEEALNLAKAVDEIVITEDEVGSIRDTKTKIDAGGNVYAATRIYNGKFIRRDKSNGTTLEVPFTRVIENFGKDYEYQSTDGTITIVYSSGNGYLKINGSIVMEEPYGLDPQNGDDLGVYEDDSYVYEFKRAYASFPVNPTDRLSFASQLDSLMPKRVSNDADTSRIDGEGNVYDVINTPTDNYITVTYNTGLVRKYNYNQIDTSGNYEFKYTGGNDYIQYKQDTGYVSLNYSRVATANKVDPLNDEQIVVSSISATNITSIVHTPQKSAKTETQTDRLARESQLDTKLDKSGGDISGSITSAGVVKSTAGIIISKLTSGHAIVRADSGGVSQIELSAESGRCAISSYVEVEGEGRSGALIVPVGRYGTIAVTDELGYSSNDDAWGDPFGYEVNYITLKNRCITSAILTNAMVQEQGAIFIVCDFSFPNASTFDAVMVLEVSSDVSGSVPYSIVDNGAAEFGLDWTPGSVRTIEGGKKYLFSITTYKSGSYAVVGLQELSE